MNLFDPVRWGAQAAYAVASTAVKIGLDAVRAAEALLGRADGDDARYEPVATTPQGTPPRAAARVRPEPVEVPPAAPARAAEPRGPLVTRSQTPPKRSEVDRHRVEARRRGGGNGSTLVETEGAAAPGATLVVDPPWDGYDKMKAADIVGRVRGADPATKGVVLLYEQTHKKRKSVLAAAR